MDDAGLGPKNTKPPTLAGPYRLYDYAGPAWYQRDIEIPAAWQGKRVTLFLERCRWVTTVWLDDQCIGSQDSLIAPHVFDFGTAVSPGKHRLTICVDNTVKINLGEFVSALFGGTWGNMNGIVGKIELVATPSVWIDDVQVYPDVDKKLARVVVKIGNATGKAGKRHAAAWNEQASRQPWDENGGQAEVDVDMSGAKLWDEFTPTLSEVTVKLGEDRHTVRFGMTASSRRGTQLHHQRPAGVSARDAGVLGVSADRLCSVVLRPPGLRQSDCLEATYGPAKVSTPPLGRQPPNSVIRILAISYTGHECQWNGPSWPYSTAVTLTAMANLLNDYRQDAVGRKDYLATLKIYAKSHHLTRKDGAVVPWIDENLNPFTGDWIARTLLAAAPPAARGTREGLQPLDVLRTWSSPA